MYCQVSPSPLSLYHCDLLQSGGGGIGYIASSGGDRSDHQIFVRWYAMLLLMSSTLDHTSGRYSSSAVSTLLHVIERALPFALNRSI